MLGRYLTHSCRPEQSAFKNSLPVSNSRCGLKPKIQAVCCLFAFPSVEESEHPVINQSIPALSPFHQPTLSPCLSFFRSQDEFVLEIRTQQIKIIKTSQENISGKQGGTASTGKAAKFRKRRRRAITERMEIKLEYREPAWWSSFLGQEVDPNLQSWLKYTSYRSNQLHHWWRECFPGLSQNPQSLQWSLIKS